MTNRNYEVLNNTWQTFRNLIAYDLFTFKVVFNEDGDEIVYVNDGAIGRLKVYVNGEPAYRGWDFSGGCFSVAEFRHKDKSYKIKCVVNNLISWSQKVTLSVDGELRHSEIDQRFGGFSLTDYGRMTLGFVTVGILVGLTLKLFGV